MAKDKPFFYLQSVERAIYVTHKQECHNDAPFNSSLTFDFPVLLRNSEGDFKERLQFFFFTHSNVFKTQKKTFPSCKNPEGTFPRTSQSFLYSFLFKSPSTHTML